jgi:hypothetical protein
MQTKKATGTKAQKIARMAELYSQQKAIETELKELWELFYSDMDTMFGAGEITKDDDGVETKKGDGRITGGGFVIGRNLAEYGAKVVPEKLKAALGILVREGVLSDDEFNKIIDEHDETTTVIDVNETYLNALATVNDDVRRAVKKSLTPSKPQFAKVAPTKE